MQSAPILPKVWFSLWWLAETFYHQRCRCPPPPPTENFLLSDKSDKAVVKAIDFGQSTFFTRDQKFDDPVRPAPAPPPTTPCHGAHCSGA